MSDKRSITLFFGLVVALMVILLSGTGVQASASDLFFSEYIEGSSFNKAIEIYNGTGNAVDLAAGGYTLELYSNGSDTVSQSVALSGTVADGDVFVISHGSADPAILAVADATSSSVINFNGDDAFVLRKSGAVVDAFGQVGTDPGSEWPGGGKDDTLRRAEAVCAGDTNTDDAFDASVEWVTFPINTFDGLGSHVATCNGGGGPNDPVINEFSASTTGSPDVEYVEVIGDPGTDYSALTIIEVEGDSTRGNIDRTFPVGMTDGGGFWTTSVGNLAIENGSITLLLVEGFTGSVGNDIDTDDDGVIDFAPWTRIVDDVAVTDGGASDLVYSSVVLGPNYDGVSSFAPGGASRIPDGLDTEAAGDWVRNDFDLAGIPGFSGTIGVGEAYNTPGASNEIFVAPPEMCGDPVTLISAIQGSGSTSPLLNSNVSIEGIVVGDFQDDVGSNGDLNGFFVQEEDTDADTDAQTSEGIFVFQGSNPTVDVNIGDKVRVSGLVDEFFGLTQIDTLSFLDVCSFGNALPTVTDITLPVSATDDLEIYEGMYVRFPQSLSIVEYFNFDRFNEIVLATDRLFQPTAVYEPGSTAAADLADLNSRSVITLDDGRTASNPDPAIHPNGNVFDLTNRFRGGDLVTNATGVLNYSFNLYRIQPTQGAEYIPVNERPPTHEPVGGSLEVASFNVLNYFNTIDDGTNDICGASQTLECRGADNEDERLRQLAKIVAAMTGIKADVFGVIEVENTPGVEAMADIVDGLNVTFGTGTYDYVDTGVIGSDAIKVGFIYNTTTVTPSGDFAVLDDPAFVNPFNASTDRNRPALAQTFMENANGAKVTVVVNHLKSKGSGCGTGDDDPEQGSCNLTRTVAAQVLVDWLDTDPTNSGDGDFLVVGDLNAYDKEDPIDVLTGAGYADLAALFNGEFAYSYVFSGQLGYLDYALANSSLLSQVTGATEWHINADEPDILDYDTSFKKAAQDALYEPNAYRASDHDPVVVGLDLNAPPVCTTAVPSVDTLWSPNHEFVAIDVLGVTDLDGDLISIVIDSIFQDEAVDAPGSGNTTPDGQGVGTATAEVRAERAGNGNGRYYHIAFTAADGQGHFCSSIVTVSVPKNQGNNGAAVDDGPLFNSTLMP